MILLGTRPAGAPSEAIAFGRRLVPYSFLRLPFRFPSRWFCWGGYLHAFSPAFGVFFPIVRAVAVVSRWEPGPPTEPMVDLAATAREEFTALPVLDAHARCEFGPVHLSL